ncbi:maleylacetoacetate isomerase [Anaeromyxobacter diazotrophicus]|uniref:Maleylacetoacetate isomerase n=1 Tax=Anaeromyxobacter diazotrophicus TaxID=2590199 RepID=A0A7I9VRM0_9BACT|nr:maleylacetoacetate isomerase [Anaeromyxobacter diazotrophicus]GEJ59082.1 maleylacetoacetate isomerase [Anaeromyxobacter diazotrophicus]
MTAPHLTLHGYWRSSSAWRVRIGLHLKALPFTYRAVNLAEGEQRGEAHRAVSPLGQVPVLTVEEGGAARHLVQSMAILEWLEERFPAPPLLPPDAFGRARVRALAEHVNSGIQPYQNAAPLRWLREREPRLDQAWTAHWLPLFVGGLERAVADGAGRFCHGDSPTLADVYVVPQLYGCRRFGVDVSAFPTLLRVEAACRELDAFRRAEPEAQPDAPPPEKRS